MSSSSCSGHDARSLCSICEVDTAQHVFDLSFHPTRPLLAATLVTGHVNIYRHGGEGGAASSELSQKLRPHKTSCRTARFLSDELMVSGSKNGGLTVTNLSSAASVWRSSYHS
eukprot:GHVS01000969.1.p1 GENE.GHVS01000969.1~~GHVS01000969.1.p1  ORF type:complete len:113 (+),score=23.47 GHVS01000969.1:141-479(+)